MDAQTIMHMLDLKPLEMEGGFFRETYRSEEKIASPHLPDRYLSDKCFSTCIYYFLTPETFSQMHIVPSDEIFHFYMGDPVEMVQLFPDGSGKRLQIGTDLSAGQRPQVLAPKGVWQGCKLKEGGHYALMGTTVAPGFDYPDYIPGKREELLREYPAWQEWIEALTKE